MAALYILFLVGFDKTTFHLSINLCKVFAALIHFSGLAIFFWTLVAPTALQETPACGGGTCQGPPCVTPVVSTSSYTVSRDHSI